MSEWSRVELNSAPPPPRCRRRARARPRRRRLGRENDDASRKVKLPVQKRKSWHPLECSYSKIDLAVTRSTPSFKTCFESEAVHVSQSEMEMSAETENKDQLNYSGELQDLSNSGVTDAPSSKSAGKEGEKSRAPYSTSNDPNMLDVVSGKPCKLSYKVLIPVDDFPKFNFVGKILGPKGNSLKRLQEETGTRMAVLGRGSMRDKSKEEQLRQEGGKYSHLNEPLHVWIEAYAQPSDALARLAHAVAEVKKYLNPDYNDDIRQQQLEELVTLGEIPDRGRGLARGMGHMRGGPVGPAMSPRGLPPRPAPPVRGMPMPPRGSMPMRPGLSRGAMPMSRGSPASARPPMSAPRTQNEYYDYGHREGGSDGYGYEDGYSGPGSASGYGKAPPSVRGRGDYRPRPY